MTRDEDDPRLYLNRRRLLSGMAAGAAASLSGCTGDGGGTPTPREVVKTKIVKEEGETVIKTVTPEQRNEYLQAAAELGVDQNWRQRRVDIADDWPIDARRDQPDRGSDTSFRGFDTLETAPWEPPDG